MPVVNAYCSVADVRGQFGDSGERLDETLLERAISAASRAVDRWCGRRFWADPAPVARLYRALCTTSLDVADISAVAGLVVEVDGAGLGTWQALDEQDYHLEPLNADADGGAYSWTRIVVDSGPGLPAGDRPAVRVTAAWGWSAIPDEVVQAAIIKTTSLFKRKDAPFGIAGVADFGVVRIGRSDPDVVDLLRAYRIPVMA